MKHPENVNLDQNRDHLEATATIIGAIIAILDHQRNYVKGHSNYSHHVDYHMSNWVIYVNVSVYHR